MSVREKLEAALRKPLMAFEDSPSDDEFDPWGDVISGIYGNYSSEMDDIFIDALKAVRDGQTFVFIARRGAAGEMALYALAGHGLTEYGTSPRGAWPDPAVKDLWQPLIDKWDAHRRLAWGSSEERPDARE